MGDAGNTEPLKKKAVFLDRDGVINKSFVIDGKPYAPRTFEDFKVYEHAKLSLALLKKRGFKTIVISNQPDIGNGLMRRNELVKMHNYLMRTLDLDKVKVCCHGQDDGCVCRKPRPGMLLDVQNELDLCMEQSWLVGDRDSDLGAGIAAGVRTIFVDRGYKEPVKNNPDFIVSSLIEAVEVITESLNNLEPVK